MQDIVSKQLTELRRQYQNNRVSVMVGAGFSKNACPDFPSWNELLYDMVVEMFQGEIEAAYLRFLKLTPSTKMSLDVFTKDEVNRIINRIGPLNLVSKYIEQKGFRESIEYYIEERIPYIDKTNNEFRYTGKNEEKRVKIIPDHFSAHIKLVKGQHWVKRYTTNYDRLLEYAANMEGRELAIITKAKNLSVFRDDPTLIKLHGDLYHPNEPRDFRFDGNPHQQYIISAEDYKTYPKDHEAFTQLMRISLLQGVFCLIGFSGDDPNFVNWIEWVRDILERDDSQQRGDEEKDYKIYLIGLSKELPKLDKQIFYENHNIFYIPILRDDVQRIIGSSATDEIREVFCHFLDYLEKDDYPQVGQGFESSQGPVISSDDTSTPQTETDDAKSVDGNFDENKLLDKKRNLEQTEKKEYLELWNHVYESKIEGELPKFSHRIIIDEEKLARLRQIKGWNRFVNSSDQQRHFISSIHNNSSLTVSEAQLAILALRDTGILVDNNLIKIISESGIGDEDLQELNKLVNRAKTLCADWTVEDKWPEYPLERILNYLYELDFTSARALLKEWEPVGVDIIKKAMLLFFFMEDGAKELLQNYVRQEGNAKERYYATRLLNLVEGVFPQKHSLAVYENANIQDYSEVLSNYIKRVKDTKEKIVRYGDGRNEKIFYMDGKPNKLAEAMAALNFIVEAPAMPSYRNFYTLINAENWYPIHSNLFDKFPYPILFYDLMCLDKKVRSRIGQDYAYSDHLRETCLDSLLVNMLKAFLSEDSPFYLKESLLTISKEFFVSVPSVKWDELFMQIWDKNVIGNRLENKEDRLNDVIDTFINKGLNSIKSLSARQRVITDVLRDAKKDTGFAINCLYYLHVVKGDGKNNQRVSNAVQEFIAQIEKPEELTIAGNIYRLLTKEQIELVANKCVSILNDCMGKKIDKVVYQSAQFFVKDDPVKRKVYLESVCKSPILWESGVTKEGHYTSFTYLHVTSFIRRIYLDKESLLIIYNRLKDSLEQISRFNEAHKSIPLLGDLDGLLAEMLSFLNYYRNRLSELSDFEGTYTKAQSMLKIVSGVNNTEEGLLSPYEEELRDALSFIYVNRDTLTHQEIAHYVNIIINRTLLRNSDGLDTCIGYLRLYLNDGLIGKNDNALIEGLVSILKRYDKDMAQECNMNLVMVTRDMSKIGMALRKMGYTSEGINYWIELQGSGRFVTNF